MQRTKTPLITTHIKSVPEVEELGLVVGSVVQEEDGSNPAFVQRNPARDKAEKSLRSTEKKLVQAEQRANIAVEAREKTRGVARVARERLRTAETAYVQVCAWLFACDTRNKWRGVCSGTW